MRHCLGLSGGTGRSFPRSSPDCTDLGLGRLTPQRAAQAAAPRIPVASTAGIAGCGRALTATVPRYPARGWVVGRRVGGCWVSMGVPEELSTSVLRRTAAEQQQQRTRARGVPGSTNAACSKPGRASVRLTSLQGRRSSSPAQAWAGTGHMARHAVDLWLSPARTKSWRTGGMLQLTQQPTALGGWFFKSN